MLLLIWKWGFTMLKLSVSDIVRNDENCYSFVVAVSKRARQIAEEQRDDEVTTEEKPVQLAVEEFVEGKYHIIQPDLNAEAEADAAEEAQKRVEEAAVEEVRKQAVESKKQGEEDAS